MKTIFLRISCFLMLAFLPLSINTSATPTRAEAGSPFDQEHFSMQRDQRESCYPGSGWRWTEGPTAPETAGLARKRLEQIGVEALVTAQSYGETDSCGTYQHFGIDFQATILGDQASTALLQQAVYEKIYPIFKELGQPNLGNVTLTFPDQQMVVLHNNELVQQAALPDLISGWQEVSTAHAPSARYIQGMAYDSARNLTLLFGGDNTGYARLNDTWQYDGTDWIQLSPTQSPPGRVNIDQALVYDTNRNKVVLFGGLGSSNYLNDTWEFDGTNWSQVSTSTAPGGRDAHAMAFDSQAGTTVLFGGYYAGALNDTWEYNRSWQQVNPPQSPGSRVHHAMAYDSQRHVTVMFGGRGNSGNLLGDTWEYDGTTWTQVTPVQSPPARDNHGLAYDSQRGVIVLFGGNGSSGILNDTWEYNGTTWNLVTTNPAPPARGEMPLVYDQHRGKIILFGGGYWASNLVSFGDTWEYSAAQSTLNTYDRKVYVIVYDPILSNSKRLSEHLNWNSHTVITQDEINFFKLVSNNRVTYSVAFTSVVNDWPVLQNGYDFTEQTYLDVLNHVIPAPNSMVNYNAIVNDPQFDICGKANSGEIDEVWIYNGPAFGFWESTLVGPGAYWYNSSPVPGPYTCTKLIPIMGPSPERALSESTENFGHRTESTMFRTYGKWEQNHTDNNWEKFTLIKAKSPSYSYSGCGNIHYPPNGTSDYDWGNASTAQTNCEDFSTYPNLSDPLAVLQPVTCSTWGCNGLGYFNYWFSHFPHNPGCGSDQKYNDWWNYFASPAKANAQGCYQIYLPGVRR